MSFLDLILSWLKPVVPPSVTPVVVQPVTPIVVAPPSIVVPTLDIFSTVALPLILIFEGGLTNDKNDKGGRTNFGVTQTEYDVYRTGKKLLIQTVANITSDEVKDIYLNHYWLPSKCDQMGDKLSVMVFDTSVNMGQGRSIKFLQGAIGAKVDGVIGPETIAKMKTFDINTLVGSYIAARKTFYQNIVKNDPTQEGFLDGWLRRLQFVSDYISGVKTLDQIRKSW